MTPFEVDTNRVPSARIGLPTISSDSTTNSDPDPDVGSDVFESRPVFA